MKILMTTDCVGGVWTYAMELCAALEPHRVEVVLATMGPLPHEDQMAQVRRLPHVSLHVSEFKLEWMENPWTDVHAAGEWLIELEQQHKPHVIHLNGYAHGSLPWRAPVAMVGHSCVLSWWQAVNHTVAPSDWNRYR